MKFLMFARTNQNMKKVFDLIQREYGSINYQNIKKNKADVLNTHGDNSKIKKLSKIKNFQKFEKELIEIVNWFKRVRNLNLF